MSHGKSETSSDFFPLDIGKKANYIRVDGGCMACECLLSGDIPSGNRHSYKLFMTGIGFCSHPVLYQPLLIEKAQQNLSLYTLLCHTFILKE